MDRIRPHLVPLILGGLGLILIIFGLAQLILRNSASSKVDYKPASESPNTSTETITIDVEGAVMKPGVYKIGSNSRLVDALAAAGGMSEDADRGYVQKNINLAQKASDGLKLYIPRLGEQVLSASNSTADSPGPVLNINSATFSDIDSLQGVGQVTADKIIQGRPYSDINELVERKIVGQAVFEKIKDKISAN